MNIKNDLISCYDCIDCVVLKRFNIYYQYVRSYNQFLILEAYSKMKRSKNELEKQTNKL